MFLSSHYHQAWGCLMERGSQFRKEEQSNQYDKDTVSEKNCDNY